TLIFFEKPGPEIVASLGPLAEATAGASSAAAIAATNVSRIIESSFRGVDRGPPTARDRFRRNAQPGGGVGPGSGGPATGRSRARRASAARRPRGLGDARAHISGDRVPDGVRSGRQRGRRRGGGAGRVRQGPPRARPLPPRRGAQALVAADRRQRGP